MDTTTGEYLERYVDLSFRNRGFPFELARRYGSQVSSKATAVGYGWHCNLDTNVTEDESGITVLAPDGASHAMTLVSGSTYKAGDDARIRLRRGCGRWHRSWCIR